MEIIELETNIAAADAKFKALECYKVSASLQVTLLHKCRMMERTSIWTAMQTNLTAIPC